MSFCLITVFYFKIRRGNYWVLSKYSQLHKPWGWFPCTQTDETDLSLPPLSPRYMTLLWKNNTRRPVSKHVLSGGSGNIIMKLSLLFIIIMYIIYYAYYAAYRWYWEHLEDPETEGSWLEQGTMTGNWSRKTDWARFGPRFKHSTCN